MTERTDRTALPAAPVPPPIRPTSRGIRRPTPTSRLGRVVLGPAG